MCTVLPTACCRGLGVADWAHPTTLLQGGSTAALHFLESAGLNLSSLVQLGGHSRKRTHANPSGPNVGFAIMKALQQRQQQLPNIWVVKGANVTGLVKEGGRVTGVAYTPTAAAAAAGEGSGSGEVVQRADAVVLATGGFGANKALLRQHAPAAAELATTNGAFAQGEGLALGTAAGAALVGMDQVQVHPTGFVDPAAPEAGTKFLAAEKLRGVGAVLLNSQGQRFVDELTTRDKVAQASVGAGGCVGGWVGGRVSGWVASTGSQGQGKY